MILGLAPIVDFDGTLVNLAVDWVTLRRELSVQSIDDLWTRHSLDWGRVTEAEVNGAATGAPVAATLSALEEVRGFAVLTSNHESAVVAFLRRFPELRRKTLGIAGRDILQGPKRHRDCFARGFAYCEAATRTTRGPKPVVYVGDSAYELRYAKDLGAQTWQVSELRESRLAAEDDRDGRAD